MSNNYKDCATSFANELLTNIEVANETINVNLDPKKIEKINFIVDTYVVVPPVCLEPIDIVRFDIEDVCQLLELTNANKDFIEDVSKNFSKQSFIYRTSPNKQKKKEANDFFQSIINVIKNYLNDYENINDSQNKVISNRIDLYTHVSDMLLNDKKEYISDIDEIVKVMGMNGITPREKWMVLAYVSEKNDEIYNSLKKDNKTEVDVDIEYQANRLRNKYLLNSQESTIDYEHIRDIVSESLVNNSIDMDFIPMYAHDIAIKYTFDESVVQNVLVAILVNVLFNEHLNDLDNQDLLAENKYIINNLLIYELPYKLENTVMIDVIRKAKEIIKTNMDLYDEILLLTKQEIYNSPEDTIDDLVNRGMSLEQAIHSKKKIILRLIDDKLSSIKKDLNEEQTNLLISELVDLMDIYDYYIYQEVDMKEQKGK